MPLDAPVMMTTVMRKPPRMEETAPPDRRRRFFLSRAVNLTLVVPRLHDRARDASALGDLIPVLRGPLADRLILIAARPPGAGRGAAAAGPRLDRARPAHPGGHRQGRGQRLTEFPGVLFRQVDRVTDTIESELDGAVGLCAVEVIGKKGYYLLGHGCLLLQRCHCVTAMRTRRRRRELQPGMWIPLSFCPAIRTSANCPYRMSHSAERARARAGRLAPARKLPRNPFQALQCVVRCLGALPEPRPPGGSPDARSSDETPPSYCAGGRPAGRRIDHGIRGRRTGAG